MVNGKWIFVWLTISSLYLLETTAIPAQVNISAADRVKRDAVDIGASGAGDGASLLISYWEAGSGPCAESGCYDGYCWAGCGLTRTALAAWCYTTKSYSQSFAYVKCNKDRDCGSCWSCAGSCTW